MCKLYENYKVENYPYSSEYLGMQSLYRPTIYYPIPTAMRLLQKEAKNHPHLTYAPSEPLPESVSSPIPFPTYLNPHVYSHPSTQLLANFLALPKPLINDLKELEQLTSEEKDRHPKRYM